MQDLRESCENAGFEDVSTYIASGNLLFASPATRSELATRLRAILADHGLDNDIVLRRPSELRSVVSAAPFPDAAGARPSHLLVVFFNEKLRESAVGEITARNGPERVTALGRELCVDYVEGVGRSKLTAAVIDRYVGQPGTARNWNTLNRLIELSR